ncbi:hydroxymyristoyl-ACP dehydratase [Bacillus sp. MUM 116]|uniref:DNA-directed RNA polymerase subunit beta n=1 Tax=Bacillus sp. MUM 116 TaxID=1678002 RepID=UPI0008F57A55|nr:DNA-directed RNA polymerase subunit beta [Bacillus sp. MUM 116]OIK10632.1 hydroxymyristoyl-ACP dehydratase [Bacillus sp. MUM 116]
MSEQVKTREEIKKEESQKKGEEARPGAKRVRVRLIPIWLRLILMVISILTCVMAGAAVGYGMLGGGNVTDIFKESTWTHIIDLVDKK